ncbi:bifunctional DNA primase/polymerase [Streptomyces hesseae]|uniref:Bifunctional DNA primase/polymerase n=1 Tax=Streptomyces hesseae TaxID=3075519 RepID=A0ABU2SM20_9ACTN|nr:bifunctional DNA primase/polymerase [Streptomyces sp. DSM 40473]MDT0449935.1 bifunctional DNA primase/polymerase [Streptomyces sp. DSM 40473]
MLNSGYQEPPYAINRADERRRIHDAGQRCVNDYGLYVFPVTYRGKAPACPAWPAEATRNPAMLKKWFGSGLHNIGVAMKRSDVIGIDIDRAGAFEEAEEAFPGIWAPTFTITTAKGRHLYYRVPDVELGNYTGRLPKNIDVRGIKGDGGYLVGPGSRHESGALYEAENWNVPIAPMPPVLVQVLTPVPRPARVRPGIASGAGALVPLVANVLEAVEGERNNRLHWAASRAAEEILLGFYDTNAARAALLAAALMTGLDEREADATISSAFRRMGTER